MCSPSGRIVSLCKLIGEAEHELTVEMAHFPHDHSTLAYAEGILIGRGDAWALGCFDRVRNRLRELGSEGVLVPQLAEGHRVTYNEEQALTQASMLRKGRDLLACNEIRPLIDQLDDLDR